MKPELLEELCNYLLNHGFVVGDLDATREKYYAILNNEDELQRVFHPLGYVVYIQRSLRVAHLVNLHNNGRLELRKYESILLLLLRVLYVEKRESLSVNAQLVTITVDELEKEYNKLNLPRKLDKRVLEDSMRLFKKYNFAYALDKLDDTTSRIQILPSVILAMPDKALVKASDETRAFLMQYSNQADPALTPNADEDNYDD